MLGFPGVYYYTPASAAVHKDSSVQKASELSGKVVGAAAESTYQYYLEKTLEIDVLDAPKFEFQITPKKLHILENSISVLDDLRLGDGVRMDGMVGPTEVIANAIKEGYPVRIIEPPVFYEPLSLAIDKGDKAFKRQTRRYYRRHARRRHFVQVVPKVVRHGLHQSLLILLSARRRRADKAASAVQQDTVVGEKLVHNPNSSVRCFWDALPLFILLI